MKKYLYLLKITFINRLDYRQELIMDVFVGLVYFAGQAIFWAAVFHDRDVVYGFDYNQILIYYIYGRIVSDVVTSKVSFLIIEQIMKGGITNLLMKPVGMIRWYLFKELGRIGPESFVRLIVYISLIFILGINASYDPLNIILSVMTIIPAFIISFLVNLIIGFMAFIMTNSKSLVYSFRRIVAFLTGSILPLAFFPGFMQQILEFTPFYYMFTLPINILFGKLGNSDILIGLVIQAIWVVLIYVAARIVLKISIKHNESVGI